jgi:parallel beta-helix repeat protein
MFPATFIVLVAVPEGADALAEHGAISIVGDEGFTVDNGVTSGTGSSGDPYIIEGWEIVLERGICIAIRESRAHYVIRDVHLTGGAIGISLRDAQNGLVTDSVIDNNTAGIYAFYAHDTTISNCVISNATLGINIQYCEGFSVKDVTFADNELDIKEVSLLWEYTRAAQKVFVVAGAILIGFVVLLVYFRLKDWRKGDIELPPP